MPDTSEEHIWVAVGRATTRWETLEAHLSFMYSIFEGKPVDHKTIENYGRESKIFKDRMCSLRKSAVKYFEYVPNQHEEARVEGFIKEAERLASFRHRIAHGTVVGFARSGHAEYKLMPPTHGLFHLTKRDGDYAYASKDIDGYAAEFAALATQVQRFNHERYAPA